LSTLKMCDRIVELKNGTIHRTGSYGHIIDGQP
jgi:ATP-binding cassette, subfamily B, bacterial PglK